MPDRKPEPDWGHTAAIILGNANASPAGPGSGACVMIIYDPTAYESFREACRRSGQDPETDPTMQLIHQPDRELFLQACGLLTELAPFLGLALMSVESKQRYEPAILAGLTPTATLAEVVWTHNGCKAAFGMN